MKTAVFDLTLTLRGVSQHDDDAAALRELIALGQINPQTEKLDLEEWNFIRIDNDLARELLCWQFLSSPREVSPFKNIDIWRSYRRASRKTR